MRRILFRGKRKSDGQWVIGDLSRYTILGKVNICKIEDNLSVTIHEIDPRTIGKLMEIRDKNGKDIYEGDIVRLTKFENDTAVFFQRKGVTISSKEIIQIMNLEVLTVNALK